MSFTLSYAQIRPDPCPALDCRRHAPRRELAAVARPVARRRQHGNRPAHDWSATENVAWKLPLPAFSGSTPIIWDDIDLPERRDRARHRAHRAVGRRSQQAGGHLETAALGRQPHRQQAEHVVAVAGHRRQARLGDDRHRRPQGFDFAGKELWTRDIQKDYGPFGIQFGYASSPLLHDDASTCRCCMA